MFSIRMNIAKLPQREGRKCLLIRNLQMTYRNATRHFFEDMVNALLKNNKRLNTTIQITNARPTLLVFKNINSENKSEINLGLVLEKNNRFFTDELG